MGGEKGGDSGISTAARAGYQVTRLQGEAGEASLVLNFSVELHVHVLLQGEAYFRAIGLAETSPARFNKLIAASLGSKPHAIRLDRLRRVTERHCLGRVTR